MSDEIKGAFAASLKRNFKQIRSDRAEAIVEEAQICLKHKKEEVELQFKRMTRERENMIDLSPANSTSLELANSFEAGVWAEKDIQLGIDLRNLKIKLEVITDRYNHLFTEDVQEGEVA